MFMYVSAPKAMNNLWRDIDPLNKFYGSYVAAAVDTFSGRGVSHHTHCRN